MLRLSRRLIFALAVSTSICAQQQPSRPAAVPRLIPFNGSYHNTNQQTPNSMVGATFSIYREQYDGTPLWTEVQNVQPDKDGRYSALLGSMHPEGVPVELFFTSEPRWLEVEIDQAKQPRVLLGSVPYALKAGDAETLGGLPASAYLRAALPTAAGSANSTGGNPTAVVAAAVSPLANSGSPGCIGMFQNTTDLICSAMNQSVYQGNPAVSVGGTTYLGAMTLTGNVPSGDTAGMALYNQGGGGGSSVSVDMYNTTSNGGIPQAKIKAMDDGNYSDHLTFWTKTPGGPFNPITERVRITSSGNVGIGTPSPAAKLEVNGSVLVDGNITLSGNIMLPNTNTPVFQSSQAANSFSAGWGALQNMSSGTFNTAIGVGALGTDTTGHNNTAAGASALTANTTGANNVAFGAAALNFNTTGTGNTALGEQALSLNTTASNNTAVGYVALQNSSTGAQNTAIGMQALQSNTTGGGNSAIGVQALVANITGGANTAVGWAALGSNTAGGSNTAVGANALNSDTTGGNNIALGYYAGSNVTNGSNNIQIGNLGTASDSAVIRIGTQGAHRAAFIAGIRGITTGNNDAVPVVVDSNGQLGTVSSSLRFKKDVQDMGEVTNALMRLRPVTFRYKAPFADGSEPVQYGLIAEEVAQVYPDLVAHSADGQIETVKYQVLDSMLLNEVQKLHVQEAAQEELIHSLEQRLSQLESLLGGAQSRTDLQ